MTPRISSIVPEVIHKYTIDKQDITAIARFFQVNKKTIRSILIKNDIPIRLSNKDILGQRFGRLVAIKYIRKDINSKYIWECLCDCGTLKEVRVSDLISKKTLSCGCLRKENANFPIVRNLTKCYGDLSGVYYSTLRHNALKRGYEFTVSKQYLWDLFLSQGKKCSISGESITLTTVKKEKNTASVDRIDNKLGYIEGNVHWVHKTLNLMKLDHDIRDFIEWCKKVSNHNA